jgi:hypothetical protein
MLNWLVAEGTAAASGQARIAAAAKISAAMERTKESEN